MMDRRTFAARAAAAVAALWAGRRAVAPVPASPAPAPPLPPSPRPWYRTMTAGETIPAGSVCIALRRGTAPPIVFASTGVGGHPTYVATRPLLANETALVPEDLRPTFPITG